MPKPRGPQFEPINLLDERDNPRSYKALYHGTQAEIEIGGHVDPEKSARPGRKLAFATPSLSVAKKFSTNETGDLGFVYQVEPVDREDLNSTWVKPMKYWKRPTEEVVSNKGFRVLRQIHPK